MPAHAACRPLAMAETTVLTVVCIAFHAAENPACIPARNPCMPLIAPETTLLMASHSPIQKLRKASLLFHRVTNATTSAAMPATISTTGFAPDSRPNSPEIAPFTLPTVETISGAAFSTLPTLDTNLPMNSKTGDSTAMIPPTVKITFWVDSSRPLNFCTSPETPSMICVITGNRLSIRSIALFFSSFSAFANFWLVVFVTFAKAVSVAPALCSIVCKISL